MDTSHRNEREVIMGCQGRPADEEEIDALEKIREERDITLSDGEVVSFSKILRMALKQRMKSFAEEVSIFGLSYLVKPSSHKIGSVIRKVIWTMLLLFGVGFMVFQIYDRTSYYLSYPTVVNYRVAYNRSLRFPTVTICPEYLLSRKSIVALGPVAEFAASLSFPPVWQMSLDGQFKTPNFSRDGFDSGLFYRYAGIKAMDSILEVKH